MNIHHLAHILQNPTLVNKEHATDLELLIQEFPYFQPSRALLLKYFKDQKSFKYNQELKTTAVYTTDRSILFDLITSPIFSEDSIDKQYLESNKQSPSMPFDEAIKMKIEEAESVLNPALFYIKEKEENIPSDTIENKKNDVDLTIPSLISEEADIEDTKITTIPSSENEITNKIAATEESATDIENIEETTFLKEGEENDEYAFKKELSSIASIIKEPIEEELEESQHTTFKHSTIKEVLEDKENEVKKLEEQLEIDQPLDFNTSEVHSFKEWLKISSLAPIQRDEELSVEEDEEEIEDTSVEDTNDTKHSEASDVSSTIEVEDKAINKTPEATIIKEEGKNTNTKNNFDLIDQFIANNPKIPPVKKGVPNRNLASDHIIPTDSLMTETLAKVYLAQKNYKKAIQAYKILILKNPEKSGFFADQIRAINKLQDNK